MFLINNKHNNPNAHKTINEVSIKNAPNLKLNIIGLLFAKV